jgi:hypothetical protein
MEISLCVSPPSDDEAVYGAVGDIVACAVNASAPDTVDVDASAAAIAEGAAVGVVDGRRT